MQFWGGNRAVSLQQPLLCYSSKMFKSMTGYPGNISGRPNSSLEPVILVITVKNATYFA